MKLKSTRVIFVSMLTAILAAATPISASAESLAGKVGDKRHSGNFNHTEGACGKAYKDYVAASGHSAYAQTPIGYRVEAFFCGGALNAPTQKEAEKRALANCNATFTKYKLKTTGKCTVYASK